MYIFKRICSVSWFVINVSLSLIHDDPAWPVYNEICKYKRFRKTIIREPLIELTKPDIHCGIKIFCFSHVPRTQMRFGLFHEAL